ncbi:MAG: hypothetical protein AAFP10_01630 [Pseudomonadota bacterium]
MSCRLPLFDTAGDEGALLRDVLHKNEEKLEKLRSLQPTILDLSIREPTAYSAWGHRLSDKLDIFHHVREFGFTDIMLGLFKAADTVDEQFCKELTDEDKSGCFVFSPTGVFRDGELDRSQSQPLLKAAALAPNVLFEFAALDADEAGAEAILERFDLSIQWIRRAWQQRGIERGPRNGRVYINIYDTFEAFYRNTDIYVRVIKYLGQHPGVDGVLFEDEQGTSFHFQVGELTRLIRSLIPAQKKLLAHLHDNTGTMYASALEAVLNGADGLWAGFTPMGGMLNSSASSVFLANLLRIGNPYVQSQFKMQDTIPLAKELDRLNQPVQSTDYCHPVIGEGAYLSTLRGFEQRPGEHMALPPETVGAERGFRVVPAIASNYVVSRRLDELGISYPSEPSQDTPTGRQLQDRVFRKIWDMMQETLIAGHKVDCNDAQVLREYLDRARQYFRDHPDD